MSENQRRDLSNIGRYLAMLKLSIEMCKENNCEENRNNYKKYLRLYCDEYKKQFGEEPKTENLKAFIIELEN